jgi:hypothetical protein
LSRHEGVQTLTGSVRLAKQEAAGNWVGIGRLFGWSIVVPLRHCVAIAFSPTGRG